MFERDKPELSKAFGHIAFGFNFWTLAKSKSFHWMLAIVAIIMLFLYSEKPWVAIERLGALQTLGHNDAMAEVQPQLEEMKETAAEAQAEVQRLKEKQAKEQVAAAQKEAEAAQREADSLRNELAARIRRDNERVAALEQERDQALERFQRRQELAKM